MAALKLEEIDAILIRYADTESLNAISARLGGVLTAQQCGARISQLLDTPDWLTQAKQSQLVTQKMRLLVVALEEMLEDRPTSRTAEVLGAQLERLGNQLEKRQAATESDLNRLYAFEGGVLLDAVTIALNHMKSAITGGSAVAGKEWDDAMESAIRLASIEIGNHEPTDAGGDKEVGVVA